MTVGYNTGLPAGSTGGRHSLPKSKDMKEGIHPAYRDVVFQDMASGFKFITRSTVNSREKIKMEDGKEYPLFKLDVTSESHPFYTGAQQRIIETGRVEKFRQKFARGGKAAAPAGAETQADEGSSKA
jgi:large subunit ribosomal protein L31